MEPTVVTKTASQPEGVPGNTPVRMLFCGKRRRQSRTQGGKAKGARGRREEEQRTGTLPAPSGPFGHRWSPLPLPPCQERTFRRAKRFFQEERSER